MYIWLPLRRIGPVIAAGLAAHAMLLGQQTLRVQVSASVPNAVVYVDGVPAAGAAYYMWEAGSRHTIATDRVQERVPGTRYRFLRWTSAGTVANAQSDSVEVVASPSATSYQAVFATEYALSVVLFVCPMPAFLQSHCTQPGTLVVNGREYNASANIYVPGGEIASLRAIPGANYVFAGWGNLPGVSGNSASIALPVTRPLTVAPQFKPVSGVTFEILTEPPGLRVAADGVELNTPASLSWPWFSDHVLSAATPQRDREGNWWVFSGWSDAGTATHTVSVRGGLWPDQFVARFVRAVPVDIVTSPTGLKLQVDGQDCTQCSFVWPIGQAHTIAAPPGAQFDKDGLSYAFRAWSSGEAGPLQFTPQDVPGRMRLAAMFDHQGLITVETVPPGVRVKLGDIECSTPCRVQKPLGAQVQVRAPASHNTLEGSRLDFVQWADSGPASRSVTATADPQLLRAAYKTMNGVTALAEPAGAATFHMTPESPDGYYEVNSRVTVAVTPRPGYRFRRWEGDLAGSEPSGGLVIGGSRTVRALLEPVPYLLEPAVANAASGVFGPVAPCSVISIAGLNLAAAPETGPADVLRQSLAGVAVRSGSRLLGLYSVNAEQIQAQLPCDLPEGAATLYVKPADFPELTAEVTVVRNAPGLFAAAAGGRPWAVGEHEDGSAVTPEQPARPGEVVTVYGTGFGPLLAAPRDGFAPPEGAGSQVADEVEVLFEENIVRPLFAGAAPDRPGLNVVRFRVVAPAGGAALKVRVNGREGNAVILPVGAQ